jgi:putative transcriptional regulator
MPRRWAAIAILTQAAFCQQLQVGKLLVATPKSHDSELAQSVILLVHYGEEGVIGLMINRRTGSTFVGGPIPLGVRTVFRSRAVPEGADHIFGDVYMTTSPIKATVFRAYAGYTGWSIQQVKDEIARGLWTIRPGEASIVFDPNPRTVWSRLRR